MLLAIFLKTESLSGSASRNILIPTELCDRKITVTSFYIFSDNDYI